MAEMVTYGDTSKGHNINTLPNKSAANV